MSSLRALSALILGSCLVSLGCMVSPDEPNPASDEPTLETEGFGGNNGLTPACFWDFNSQVDLRNLAKGPIAMTNGMMVATPSVPTSCFKLLQDVAECALAPSQSVTNQYDGTVYHGIYGLGQEWMTGALSGSSRQWVTGCLLQRLNFHGIVVPTLQVGNDAAVPGYKDNAVQDQTYSYRESTAWGDLFSSTNTSGSGLPAFFAYVCSDDSLARGCGNDLGSAWIHARVCDSAGSPCGLNFMGMCRSAGSGCTGGSPYWTCGGDAYTVSVRLQPNPPQNDVSCTP
jgi:hypothetical protein